MTQESLEVIREGLLEVIFSFHWGCQENKHSLPLCRLGSPYIRQLHWPAPNPFWLWNLNFLWFIVNRLYNILHMDTGSAAVYSNTSIWRIAFRWIESWDAQRLCDQRKLRSNYKSILHWLYSLRESNQRFFTGTICSLNGFSSLPSSVPCGHGAV